MKTKTSNRKPSKTLEISGLNPVLVPSSLVKMFKPELPHRLPHACCCKVTDCHPPVVDPVWTNSTKTPSWKRKHQMFLLAFGWNDHFSFHDLKSSNRKRLLDHPKWPTGPALFMKQRKKGWSWERIRVVWQGSQKRSVSSRIFCSWWVDPTFTKSSSSQSSPRIASPPRRTIFQWSNAANPTGPRTQWTPGNT